MSFDYKQIIEESGLKKIHIAKRVGISPTYLSLFIHNKKNLSHERLRMLNMVLGLNN